eukprot:4637945-Amphidinium_carterae.1
MKSSDANAKSSSRGSSLRWQVACPVLSRWAWGLHQGNLLWLRGPRLSVDLHERELALAYVEACGDAASCKCVLSSFSLCGAYVSLDVDANTPTCCELVAAGTLAWRRVDGPTFILPFFLGVVEGRATESMLGHCEDVHCMLILRCSEGFLGALPVISVGVQEVPWRALGVVAGSGPVCWSGMLERLEPGSCYYLGWAPASFELDPCGQLTKTPAGAV